MPISRSLRSVPLLVALLLSPTAWAADSGHSDKVSFYFAAHEDDWQLFMNPSAFEDVTGGAAKTVFVHVTAGDDGLGVGSGGRKRPYYLARENGALDAIRFMADADKTPIHDFSRCNDFQRPSSLPSELPKYHWLFSASTRR